jgi:Tfp pilus assembly protein PilX
VQWQATIAQQGCQCLWYYSLQAQLAAEAERLATQQRAAADAQDWAAATLRAVEEDIDQETEQLKDKCASVYRPEQLCMLKL